MSNTDPFIDSDDVAVVMLRPLTEFEQQYTPGIIEQASALLRLAAPSIDDRIARWSANPADMTAISPAAVGAVVAGVVKRYLINPSGIASTSETTGPFSKSTSYALRSEKETRGVLQITQEDLATLFPSRKRLRAGTIRVRAALAPRPVGRYGPISSYGRAVESAIMFDSNKGLEMGVPLFAGPDNAA